MENTKKTEKDNAMRERVEFILQKHDITTQEQFMNEYNKKYCSDANMEINSIKDQSHVHNIFSKFNVEKREGSYQIVEKMTFSDRLLKEAGKSINEIIGSNKTTTCVIIAARGKENFICEAIRRKFNPSKTALIPAYGSVVIIGETTEVAKIQDKLPINQSNNKKTN